MSRRRKIGLISTSTGFALVAGGLQAVATQASFAQTAILLLVITAAAAFVLSFLCLERALTLLLFLSAAVIGGLTLTSTPHGAMPDWQYVWSLEAVGLTVGVAGFTLSYLRDESEPRRSVTV